MSDNSRARISPARLALAARKLRQERSDLSLLNSDPIAVIGMACRFPAQSHSPEEYWAALTAGRSGIVEMSERRWPDPTALEPAQRLGGYLDAIDGFDAEYFGIAPREANQIDPQQRLMLEVVWEALWDAGVEPSSLAGAAAGVFAAIYNSDYARMHFSDRTALGAYAGIGTAHSVAAGRISYLLDVRGPSLAVDTACSSSLVATHLAVQSLRSGECSVAIVAASSLKVLPDEVLVFSKWGMLARDGKCKTFDATADGFAAGEGSGTVILKRLSEALQDGDRIRAVIRGTAVNHDGRTTVLTAPNGLAQQSVIRAALQNAQIGAADVGYIETHGTGTSLGDPIEVEALQAIYGTPNGNSNCLPCVLGAVKTNLGHLEAAAGLAGMIKAVLCLENGAIPRNLHFHTLNPQISLHGSRFVVPTETTAWPRGTDARVAGISSFGLGGTNAHVIMEEAPTVPGRQFRAPLAKRLWNRVRCWLPEQITARATVNAGDEPVVHPLLGRRVHSGFVRGLLFEAAIGTDAVPYLGGHRLEDRALLPFAGFLEMSHAAGRQSLGDAPFAIENFAVEEPLFLEAKSRVVQTFVSGDQIEIASECNSIWTRHARGVLRRIDGEASTVDIAALRARCSETLESAEIYRRMESTGLRFGPAFRGMVSVWRGPAQSLARLRLPEELERETADYTLHPVLLDACLQAVIAALPEVSGDLLLPVAVDEFRLLRSGMSEAWAHVVLHSTGPERIVADISIMDAAGKTVALLRGFQAKRIAPASITGGELKKVTACQIVWRPELLPECTETSRDSRRWLLVEGTAGNSAELAARLADAGFETLVSQLDDSVRGVLESDWTDVLLHLGQEEAINEDAEWDYPERSAVEFLLDFARSLKAQLKAPRLWVVAPRVATVFPGEEISLARAPLLGLLRTLACEHPATAPVLIDIDAESENGEDAIIAEIMARGLEPIVAMRGRARYAARLVPAAPVIHNVLRLVSDSPGVLDALRWEPSERRSPGPGEIEIDVRAHGLNFRDVLNALGVFNVEHLLFGAECAGVVTRVGSEVRRFKQGDRVLAFAPFSMRSYAIVPEEYAAALLSRMTFAQAATIPVAFLTAHYGFGLAQLSQGQRVLIHAASGGLGLAAVQLAKQAGAEIFATAGSERKREFLRRLGIRHVFDSRSPAFRKDVMNATGNAGVDVVLNSLSGELIREGLETLAPGGCFLEVGKRDIWTAEEVRNLRPDLRYCAFDLGEVATENPELIRKMLTELMPEFAAGRLQPLRMQVYPVEEALMAFRTMAQASHIGKVVLSRPSQGDGELENLQTIVTQGTVLVVGGMGALGREVAAWLVAKGARRLVLAGRTADADAAFIASLRESGAEVAVEQMDLVNPEAIREVLQRIRASGLPLTAIFHVAGMVQDGVLERESWNSYRQAAAVKIEGAWNLHRLTETDPVKLMVFFSSAAGILGSPGQGSYAAGNAFLDALAHYRASRGLETLSVDWGAWAGAGMAARLAPEHAKRLLRQGVRSLEPSAALQTLEKAIAERRTQLAVLDIAWDEFLEQRLAKDQSFFAELRTRQPDAGKREIADPIGAAVLNAPTAERKGLVAAHVRDCARRAMSLPPRAAVPDDVPLQELGLDSLMAIDMKNELARSLELSLSAGLLFNYPTVRELTGYLLGLLPAGISTGTANDIDYEGSLVGMTEEEAERLLLEELEHSADGRSHA
jgi:acyl transferase domain-containing protein/acyl carrier protein